jgi:hypothetical protein
MKKDVLFIYLMMLNMLNLLASIAVLGRLHSDALLGLPVEFTDACYLKVGRSQQGSIDVKRIVFQVKFEGRLLILVLRKKGNSHKNNLGFKTDEF